MRSSKLGCKTLEAPDVLDVCGQTPRCALYQVGNRPGRFEVLGAFWELLISENYFSYAPQDLRWRNACLKKTWWMFFLRLPGVRLVMLPSFQPLYSVLPVLKSDLRIAFRTILPYKSSNLPMFWGWPLKMCIIMSRERFSVWQEQYLFLFSCLFWRRVPALLSVFFLGWMMTHFMLLCSELSFPKKAKGDLCFHVFAQPAGHCEHSSSYYLWYMAGSEASVCPCAVRWPF